MTDPDCLLAVGDPCGKLGMLLVQRQPAQGQFHQESAKHE